MENKKIYSLLSFFIISLGLAPSLYADSLGDDVDFYRSGPGFMSADEKNANVNEQSLQWMVKNFGSAGAGTATAGDGMSSGPSAVVIGNQNISITTLNGSNNNISATQSSSGNVSNSSNTQTNTSYLNAANGANSAANVAVNFPATSSQGQGK